MAETHARQVLDEVHALLQSERRRRAIHAIANRSNETTRDELARTLAADAREEVTEAAIALSLHHRHLPKLAAAGAVRYEPDTGTVVVTDEGRRLHGILRAFEAAWAE